MKVITIYGPTASGKSSLALKVAAQENGVIINADSMQVYDALHFLTAQPSKEEQEKAPHKLYAHLPASERCSVQKWCQSAAQEINSALDNNQTPIIVGGTGFYIKALIEGLSPIPDVPGSIRQEVTSLQNKLGNPAFHSELQKQDPDMAAKLNPNDTQRLIRAMEVIRATGKSLAYWQSLPTQKLSEHWEFEHHFVNPERDQLYERCNKRFDQMLENGIIEEVRSLDNSISSGEITHDAPITHALGFHPFQSYLNDQISLEEATQRAKQETRNYAKRQITWFKNQF